jgi:hypothetical protein
MQTLFADQLLAKDKLRHFKVGALFMEAGTGKTRPAVDLANSVPDVDLVAWVGPLRSIKPLNGLPSIIDEVNKWGGFNCPVIFTGVESIQGSDRVYLQLLDQIQKASNPFIIVDESIKIKNADAKRTNRMLNIGQYAQYKLILNGTPITRNLLDLWSQMEFLSPKILGMPMAEFKNTFCEWTKITKSFGGRKQYTREFITGYENIDYLYSLIKHYVYECNLKLDIKQYWNELHYNIDDESKKEYYLLKTKYLDNEKLQYLNNNIFLEMTQKMQHVYSCTSGKFEVLDEHFKKFPEDKHIIYCKYIDSHEACRKYYKKATVLSYQKESLSMNLQHLPFTIFFDKHWDYALRHQGSRRNYRSGQEYDCRYWDLTGDVGLESLIDSNINKKTSQAEYFKGITKDELEVVL